MSRSARGLQAGALALVLLALTELIRRANELVVNAYRPLEIYSFLVLEYLVLILIVSHLVRRMERHMGADESRARS